MTEENADRETDQLLFDQVYGPALREIEAFATSLWEQIAAWIEEIMPALQSFYDAVYAFYLDTGAPYGDTHEGMLRWIEERGEVARLRMEADRIKQRHQDMADWRELGRRIARRRAG